MMSEDHLQKNVLGEKLEMELKDNNKIFDPKKIYKDEPNPTEL